MPNGFAMVQESIWRDPAFRALARPAQATYVQLLSQKELDRAGVIPFQPTKWVKGCDAMGFADLIVDLDELQAAGFVYRDEDTDEVLIRSYIRHNNIVRQPNILKNALKCARALASADLRRVLAAELRRLGKAEATATADEIDPGDPTPPEGSRNPSETHPEGFPNPSRGVEPFANPSRTPQVGVEVSTYRTLSTNSTQESLSHVSNATRDASEKEPTATIEYPPLAAVGPTSRPIPDDWQPADRERLIVAPSKGVRDVDAAAERFRDWAQAHGVLRANWDAAFRQWLASPKSKQAERDQLNRTGPQTVTDRVEGWLDLANQATNLAPTTDRQELT